jgi:hypothetical protein
VRLNQDIFGKNEEFSSEHLTTFQANFLELLGMQNRAVAQFFHEGRKNTGIFLKAVSDDQELFGTRNVQTFDRKRRLLLQRVQKYFGKNLEGRLSFSFTRN